MGKQTVSLPSETQWEWAARGATKSKGYTHAGSNHLDEVGWYSNNTKSKTHPVGQLKDNKLEIHDMSGNVWEWCKDNWTSSSNVLKADGTPSTSGGSHALRGGSWHYDSSNCAVSYRNYFNSSFYYIGFRVVLS